MKNKIISVVTNYYLKHPKSRKSLAFLRNMIFPTKPSFEGWGMKTYNDPPWVNEPNSIFNLTSKEIKKLKFKSVSSTGIDENNVDTLLWRHWIVSYATKQAILFSSDNQFNFVECGVGDGLTAFFTLNTIYEVLGNENNAHLHLYDSWNPMKKDDLLENEYTNIDRYSDLEFDNTKENLKKFEKNLIFHRGYIPDVFNMEPESPLSIIYMHIDLNSKIPTIASLEYFFPKLLSGGIILFDDYGWDNHKSTKNAIDEFFKNRSGILLHLPTSQAIFFKK